MKPRAMSEWIDAAASSAVWPRRSVQARVSFSPAVKNVIRSSASRSRRTTSSSAEGPSRYSAASASDISASSASSCRSIPPGPFSTASSGFVVSGSSSAGSSPGKSRSVCPASRCASSACSCSTSLRSDASPDFACFSTRSSRRSTWSRSATSSSSSSVSRSPFGSASGREAVRAPRGSRRPGAARRAAAGPVPGTSTTRIVAGVILRAPTSAASCSSRSSAIDAMPTFSLPKPAPPVFVSAVNSVVLPAPGRPTIPTSSATYSSSAPAICFCSETSARCCSDLTAPSVLSRIVAASRVREVEDELQRQHLLLLLRERVDQLQHRLAADRLERLVLGGALLGAERLRHLLLRLPALVRAEVVHREVVGDPEEPGRERGRLEAELADRLEHAHEGLRRQVLGVVPVADGHVQVAVDPVEVDQVQLLERAAIALLAPLDELADLGRGRPLLLGLGHRETGAPRRRSPTRDSRA